MATGTPLTRTAATVACTLSLLAATAVAQGSTDRIVAWGNDWAGFVSQAPTGCEYTKIEATGHAGLALRPDGSIAAWGDNDAGIVGNAPQDAGYVDLFGGINGAYALRADGSIAAWGMDAFGNISGTPTGTGFTEVASGDWHASALTADGSIVSWGDTTFGETPPIDLYPAPTGSGFTALAAGDSFYFGLRADGTIAGWGRNHYGVLSSVPTDGGYVAIAAGSFFGMGLKADGTIVTWGQGFGFTGDDYVQISAGGQFAYALRADGSIDARHGWDWTMPATTMAPTDAGYTSISASYEGCIALRAPKLAAWGEDWAGQVSEAPIGCDLVQVEGGYGCAVGLTEDGTIVGWGYGGFGHPLSNGAPTGPGHTALATTAYIMLALTADGSIESWGWSDIGGIHSTVPPGTGHTAIEVDSWTGAALDAEGRIVTWGDTTWDIPLGHITWFPLIPEPPAGTGYKAISLGGGFGMAVAADGSLAAWGRSMSNFFQHIPAGNDFVDVEAGSSYAVALRADGSLTGIACWVPPGDDFVAISVDGGFCLALREDGTVAAWHNEGPNGQHPTVLDAPTSGGFTSISAGDRAMYALRGPADTAPVAHAGADFSVNEGQLAVTLDGGASGDPDGDALAFAWSQVGGPTVFLAGAGSATPSFDAPLVALGNETLTFQLTVTANDVSASDTVDVTVVNVNHPPVAEAGDDLEVAEGSPVALDGSASFDMDLDPFSYAWVQVGGPTEPAVTLSGAGTASPSFTAPYYGSGGAPGVVAELVFELRVDDGFPLDAPAPGYSFDDVADTVVVRVTNVNNPPVAEAGADQTVNENGPVSLSGAASSDPDSDALGYAWAQTGGPLVALAGGTSVAASFTAPFVGPGGEDLTFALTVDDGFGGVHTDTVVVHVQNANDPPLASAARPTLDAIWPPNHKLVAVGIVGVTDPDDNATITIDGVTQDEPTSGTGDGDTPVDAIIQPDGTVLLRAERAGNGNGRVYHIHFTASDLEGSASGVVTVTVSRDRKSVAVDDGELHDSTN